MKTRRTFIKQSTTVALGLITMPSAMNTSPNEVRRKALPTFENGVTIETLNSDSGFLGIGDVRIGDISLRSPRRPMFVDITTPDGVQFCNYRLKENKNTESGIELTFSMDTVNDGMDASYRMNFKIIIP